MGRCLTFIAPSECVTDSDCGINRVCCKVGLACNGGEQCRDRPVTAGYCEYSINIQIMSCLP